MSDAADLHAHPRPSIRAPPQSESVVAAMLTSWFMSTTSLTRLAFLGGTLLQENPDGQQRHQAPDAPGSAPTRQAGADIRLHPRHLQQAGGFLQGRLQIAAGAARTRERGEKDESGRAECAIQTHCSSRIMCAFFRNNKKALTRHIQVQDKVRDSAFQDWKKAVKSSLALFFALKNKEQKTAFSDLKFKRKFAPSNSIEIWARSISVIQQGEKQLVRFHPTFFELGKNDGNQLHGRLPELLHSVRLQRLREGKYCLVIPRTADFTQSRTTRVCAVDPGVRNFVTVYDPDGRTLSVSDAHSVIEYRFKRVDTLKSKLRALTEKKTLQASAVASTTAETTTHTEPLLRRQRYRQQRKIRFTLRHITKMIRDVHHKVSSWLSATYHEVLLLAFQTSEMARKYKQSAATDAAATVQPAGARAAQAVKSFCACDDGSIPLQAQEPPKIQNGEVWESSDRMQ